jgi:hypothetical protein
VFIGYSPEGVSAERRKLFEIGGFGFLPKAATLHLQWFSKFCATRKWTGIHVA